MSYLVVTLGIGFAFTFMVVIGNWIGEAIRRGAVDEARRIQLEELVKLKEKQAAEMLKDKTVEETISDLDAGTF